MRKDSCPSGSRFHSKQAVQCLEGSHSVVTLVPVQAVRDPSTPALLAGLRQVGGKVPQGQKGTPFHSTGVGGGGVGRVFHSPAHGQVDA